jgi:V8-like Glu-specific endopeptidase
MLWSALSVAGGNSTTECVEYGYAGSEMMLKCTPPATRMMENEEGYWTPERMRDAIPVPMHRAKGADSLRPPSRRDEPVREPGFDPGSLPSEHLAPPPDSGGTPNPPVDRNSSLQTGLIQKMAAVQMATQQVGIPMHSTFSVPRVLYAPPTPLYPYSTVGKVFFSTSDGNYVCSGSSIGGRAVLTAGHCVMEKGKLHTNWVFVPIYYNGEEPYGKWPQKSVFVFDSWEKDENLGRDVAFSVVEDQGSTLSARVGALGFAYNYPRERLWAMFGYPAADPYRGFEMIETLAPTAFIQDEVDGQKADPPTTGAGSIMTGGSSGGPWITDFSPGLQVSNFANGVNSYGYNGLDVMFSPYFDDSVKAMKDEAVAQ